MSQLYHCEYAWLGGDAAAADVLIVVTGDHIADVAPNAAVPTGAVPLRGLTMPGFANAHSHAFQRALRGRSQASGSFWTWRDSMYALAARLTPENYFDLARATFAEMALGGVTCVGEFHYVHHGADGNAYEHENAMGEAVVGAALDAGIRITLIDTCYLFGGIGTAPNEVQRRFSDGDAAAWSARADELGVLESSGVCIGAAVHSVRAVDPASIAHVVEWARANSAPLHAHVSEQPDENEACMRAYSRTPTQLLHDCGALVGNFTAVHATHLTDQDIALYGSDGCTVCFCPTTERDLADGIGPSVELEKAGARLSLGTDSHAVIDMIEEMRALEMNTRLRTLKRGNHATAALIAAATENGYRSLGWNDGGCIKKGSLADFVSVGLESARTAGAHAEDSVANAAVYGASGADVHHVVCGGRVVVREGRHLSIDVGRELARAIAGVV